MGTELIREKCGKRGIDTDKLLILGRGSKRYSNDRYRMSVTREKNKTQIYAIQYCKDKGIFVAWNLKKIKVPIRTVFSVSSKKLDTVNDDKNIHCIEKNVEYSGWNVENVIAFYKDGIDTFIDEELAKYV